METQKKVKELFEELLSAKDQIFPMQRKKLDAPAKKGVYIISNSRGKVLHVGSTPRAKGGISQRLKDHMYGRSSFIYNYFDGEGKWLRGRCKFKYIVVRSKKIRAYLEAYAIGSLCPEHIGVG